MCNIDLGKRLQVSHERLHQAVSLSEAVKAEAERRCGQLQSQLDAAGAQITELTAAHEAAASTQWQLTQVKALKQKAANDVKRVTADLCEALKDRDALRDAKAQHVAELTAERKAMQQARQKLKQLSNELREECERSAASNAELTAQQEKCATLTQRLADAVAVSQQVRDYSRAQGADTRAAKEAAEKAAKQAAAAEARAQSATEALEAARASDAQRDELLHDFMSQVLHEMRRIKRMHCHPTMTCACSVT